MFFGCYCPDRMESDPHTSFEDVVYSLLHEIFIFIWDVNGRPIEEHSKSNNLIIRRNHPHLTLVPQGHTRPLMSVAIRIAVTQIGGP